MKKIVLIIIVILGFTITAVSQQNTPMKIEFGIRSGATNGQSYSYLKEAGDFVILNEIIHGGQGPNYRLKVINKMNGSITNIQNIEGDYDTSFQVTEAVYNESQNAYYFGLSINNYLNQLNDSQTRIYKLDSNGLLTVMNSSVSNNQICKIKKLYIKDNYLYSICTNKIQKIDISIFEYVEEIPLIITIDEGTIEYIGNDEFVLYKTIVNINNSTDIYLVKFNINGLVLWQKTISGSSNDFVSDLICLNGDLYLCGSTNSIDGDFEGFSNGFWSDESKTAWISKLDSNSTLLWIKGYVSFENGGGFQSLLIKDNYIYASGNCHKYYNYYSGFEYNFNNNVKTVKLALNGELLWEKTYGGFNNQYFHSFGIVNNQLVYTTNLNRYAFAGWDMFFYSQGDVSAEISGKFSNPLNFSENPNQQDIWIFGTDLDGIIQWDQFYGGESNDYASSTIYNHQNIYIAANTKSSGYDVGDPIGYSDSWLFKLSADNLGNCNDLPIVLDQTFCTNATVNNLIATGTNIKWYRTAAEETALASSTVLTTGTYYVTQTINGCESHRVSVAVTITDGGLDCSTLDAEEFNTSSLKLYPNPTSSVLHFNVDNNLTNQPYNIVDTLGKVIVKGKLNEGDNSINIEHLSKGIYYIKVANDKASKFIKE